MTKSEAVEFRVDGSIAYLTLNRPEAGNAVNEEMVKSLAHYALVCDNDPNLKVVLLFFLKAAKLLMEHCH